ncbi:MAG: mannitol dehydrogenase family protein, partial [Candidatus Solibacter sp.]|nr:mannitol dehydrogenase family protein [Candidatus Solibacter sp.]
TVPQYDRSALVPGIVHIGAGGFNRSHLAVYLDDLLGHSETARWAECGIGLLPRDVKIHAALANQDHLYSLLIRNAEQRTLRIVGSIMEHIYAPDAQDLVVERMSSPECSIVSLTVTEGGYFIDAGSGAFIDQHPDIQFDLAHPLQPRTFLGYLAEAANRRMKSGAKPFTVMSCDNVECNGAAARKALLSFAELRSPELRKWIERNGSFPNSMVDRITPGTTDADREYIGAHFGISDLSPVVAEPFRQWVIEDTFCNTRPQWELVGAQLTSDVKPFEMIKMRLLNGGHSAIAYLSALLGYTHVSQAVDDALIRELLERFLEEVTCTLPQVPGMDLAQYKASIVHRFSNPTIRDQVLRVCSEGSAKIAKFIVPTVRDLLSMSKTSEILPFVIAGWLYSMRGIDEDGRATQIVDSSAGLFADFVRSGCRDEKAAFAVRSVFAHLGAGDNPFISQVKHCLDSLHSSGAREATRRALASRTVRQAELVSNHA